VSVASGATYDLAGSDTIGSIAGAGTVALNSYTLTAGGLNTSTEVSGPITGAAASLVKVGTGTLTLSGANTYSGTTVIQAGAVKAAAYDALGDGLNTLDIQSGAGLLLSGDVLVHQSAVTVVGVGSDGLGAIRNVIGVNQLVAPVTLLGNATVSSSAGSLTLSSINGAYNLSFAGNGQIVVSGSVGSIAAPSSVLINGPVLNLGGILTTPVLTIDAGSISGTGVLSIGQLTINNGRSIEAQRLSVSGTSSLSGSITTTGAAISLTDTATQTYLGAISLNGDLILRTSGTDVKLLAVSDTNAAHSFTVATYDHTDPLAIALGTIYVQGVIGGEIMASSSSSKTNANLGSLSMTANKIWLEYDVTTTGTQTYRGHVIVAGTTGNKDITNTYVIRTLVSRDPDIYVYGDIDDSLLGTHGLSLQAVHNVAGATPIIRLQDVGKTVALWSLDVYTYSPPGGTVRLLGSVTTVSTQLYDSLNTTFAGGAQIFRTSNANLTIGGLAQNDGATSLTFDLGSGLLAYCTSQCPKDPIASPPPYNLSELQNDMPGLPTSQIIPRRDSGKKVVTVINNNAGRGPINGCVWGCTANVSPGIPSGSGASSKSDQDAAKVTAGLDAGAHQANSSRYADNVASLKGLVSVEPITTVDAAECDAGKGSECQFN
jgi:autotransporter-associated beta strand protein